MLDSQQRSLLDIATAPVAAAQAVVLDGLLGEISLPIASSTAVSAPYAGRVLQVLVDEGDRVGVGQVLAWVDSREVAMARAELRRAEIAARLARTQAARDRALLAEGIIPAARAETSAAEEAARAAELAGARGTLERLVGDGEHVARYALTAPRAGTVIERHVAAGEPLDTLEVAFMLLADDGLRLDFLVPLATAAEVAAGQTVRVGTITGTVTGRAAALDVDTQSVRVRAAMPAASGLLAGQRVMVRLELPAPAGAVSVPRAAIVRAGDTSRVYRANGDRFEAVAVDVIGEAAAEAVVSGALATGEAVVVRGTSALRAMEH